MQRILSLEYILFAGSTFFLEENSIFGVPIYVCKRGFGTGKLSTDFSEDFQKAFRELALFFKGKSKKLKDLH